MVMTASDAEGETEERECRDLPEERRDYGTDEGWRW
jgi:hypothetical protein